MADSKCGASTGGCEQKSPEKTSNDVFKQLRCLNSRTPDHEVISLVWKAIRDIVVQRIMGDDGCPVPFLNEASNYGLSNVIVKERKTPLSKRPGETSSLHYAAPLESLLDPHINIQKFRSLLKVVPVPEHHQDAYKLCLKDKETEFLQIKIEASDIRHYKLDVSLQPGQIICDVTLEGIKNVEKILLITEVYVCTAMELTVIVEKSRTIKYTVDVPTPIGFCATKCTLQQNGVLLLGEKLAGVKARSKNWQDVMGSK